MIVLYTSKTSEHAEHLKERLAEMTVAHLIIPTSTNFDRLEESGQAYSGERAINQFLNEYEVILKNWNQDRCDMWDFND